MPVTNEPSRKKQLEKRIVNETKEYLVVAGYFMLFLVSVTTYRTLILKEYDIDTFVLGWAVVQAMILGKIVLIGQFLHLGDKLVGRPLIVVTLWKSVLFSLFAAFLIGAEHAATALVHHRPLLDEFRFSGGHGYEMVARFQLMLVAFVPFFALRVTAQRAGQDSLYELLFARSASGGTAGKE
jgi:hypothetical protein